MQEHGVSVLIVVGVLFLAVGPENWPALFWCFCYFRLWQHGAAPRRVDYCTCSWQGLHMQYCNAATTPRQKPRTVKSSVKND